MSLIAISLLVDCAKDAGNWIKAWENSHWRVNPGLKAIEDTLPRGRELESIRIDHPSRDHS